MDREIKKEQLLKVLDELRESYDEVLPDYWEQLKFGVWYSIGFIIDRLFVTRETGGTGE